MTGVGNIKHMFSVVLAHEQICCLTLCFFTCLGNFDCVIFIPSKALAYQPLMINILYRGYNINLETKEKIPTNKNVKK